jgi:hypothetical protein
VKSSAPPGPAERAFRDPRSLFPFGNGLQVLSTARSNPAVFRTARTPYPRLPGPDCESSDWVFTGEGHPVHVLTPRFEESPLSAPPSSFTNTPGAHFPMASNLIFR